MASSYRRYSEEEKKDIVDLYQKGFGWKKIIGFVNMKYNKGRSMWAAKQVVYSMLRKNNIIEVDDNLEVEEPCEEDTNIENEFSRIKDIFDGVGYEVKPKMDNTFIFRFYMKIAQYCFFAEKIGLPQSVSNYFTNKAIDRQMVHILKMRKQNGVKNMNVIH